MSLARAGRAAPNILDPLYRSSRIIVVAEKFDAEETYSLLQMGAKAVSLMTKSRDTARTLAAGANGGILGFARRALRFVSFDPETDPTSRRLRPTRQRLDRRDMKSELSVEIGQQRIGTKA